VTPIGAETELADELDDELDPQLENRAATHRTATAANQGLLEEDIVT